MELIVAIVVIWIVLGMIRFAWNFILPIACLVGLSMLVQSCSGARSAPVEVFR